MFFAFRVDFVDFEKFPINQDSFNKASFNTDAFEPHDPFHTNFVKVNDKMPFLKDPVKDPFHDTTAAFHRFPAETIQSGITEFSCNEDPVTCDPNAKYRTYDGHCNNVNNAKWGASMQPVARLLEPQYSDSRSLLYDLNERSYRGISLASCTIDLECWNHSIQIVGLCYMI